LLNNGHGGFVDGTSQVITGSIPGTVFPRRIVVADFNGDGRPDIFIADHGYDAPPFPGAQSTLLLSTVDGHYVDATANLPQQLAFTHSATAAVIDGSGHVALYLGNIGVQPPQLLLNDGTGHFTVSSGRLPAAQTDFNQNRYTSSQFVDVNGDGCADLVLGGYQNTQNQITQSVVLINNCQGFFSLLPNALPPQLFNDGFTLHVQPFKVGSSARPGLLMVSTHASNQGRAIQVLIGNGDGTFHDESAQRLGLQEDTGSFIRYAHLADTTGRCRLDILPEFDSSTEVRIYVNNGAGFFTRQTIGLPQVSFRPHPIDLNGIGPIDLNGIGQASFISMGGDGLYLVPVVTGNRCTRAYDFNGDGRSDILLQHTGGALAMWLMSANATIQSAVGVGAINPSVWTIIGQRDLNGDGIADILLRASDGSIGEWLMNANGTIKSANGLGTLPVGVWSIVGTGDFNGDGIGDILWYHTSGAVAVWLMNSNGALLSALGVGSLPLQWTIAGTGDFDGDGIRDILWYHTSGAVAVWLLNSNGTITAANGLGTLPVGTWSIAGTGDFNGDGISDILLSVTGNGVGIWFMNASGNVASAQAVGTMASGWTIAQTGDFNGDGKSDILWSHAASGSIGAWLLSSATITSAVGIGSLPPGAWTILTANSE
jgi:hypothetical protein